MSDEIKEEVIEEIIETPEVKPKKSKAKIIILIILGLLIIGGYFGVKYYMKVRVTMPKSHVFVSDNPEHKSDFDNWLKDDLGVNWVPTYIVFKDGYIIGTFPGDISEEEFSSKVTLASMANVKLSSIPNFYISNLNNERKSLNDLFNRSGLFILEIHWIDCPDCEEQDSKYTQSIYDKYTTTRMYRYYIKSDFDKVQEKYN